MKIAVVFVRVTQKPEYLHGEKRLLDSYLRYKPEIPHQLVFIDRCGDSPMDVPYAAHLRYDGGGWDCGAWQFAGRTVDVDLIACFNSSCCITGSGWLERFVEAVEAHGEGLYGPLASYENNPHIRTPCMVFSPNVIQGYPMEVQTREDTYRFECMTWPNGTPNFSVWAEREGFPVRLVTWDGCYPMAEWRKPENIFRRGDQSNLIVRDRHCDYYEASDEAGKRNLEWLANGK